MQVEIKLDNAYKEPKIIVLTDTMNDEINEIIRKLSESTPKIISGFKDGKIEVLDQKNLIRIYASSGKVFAATEQGEYALRLRLYELENRLDNKQFVRISNSEIINLKKVSNFDLNFSGTICVKFLNGTVTYVSRRYVAKLKIILGI